MTGVIVLGLHQGHVVFEDTTGELHTIPLTWHSAIDNAIRAGEVVELDPCTYQDRWVACDGPALTTDHNDRPVCYSHGSIDKEPA